MDPSLGGTSIDQLRTLQQMQQANPQFGNNKINVIAQDINDSLDEGDQMSANQQPQIKINQPIQDPTTTSYVAPNPNQGMVQKIPEMFREPLILVIVYVILSTDIIKNTIGEYIPQIKPKDGSVNFIGYLIYGIILAILFTVIKKLVL